MNVYIEQRPSFEEIKEVVENNDKKRYQLSAEVDASGKEVWWIRAV
jgi:RNA:NAD 2'-phosphotransferase (TPT1/KptA family)